MNIEALAREAGSDAWDICADQRGHLRVSLDGVELTEELERFAALVRAQALEEAARVADQMASHSLPNSVYLSQGCAAAIRALAKPPDAMASPDRLGA